MHQKIAIFKEENSVWCGTKFSNITKWHYFLDVSFWKCIIIVICLRCPKSHSKEKSTHFMLTSVAAEVLEKLRLLILMFLAGSQGSSSACGLLRLVLRFALNWHLSHKMCSCSWKQSARHRARKEARRKRNREKRTLIKMRSCHAYTLKLQLYIDYYYFTK